MKSFLDKCEYQPTFYHDLIKYYSDEEIKKLNISDDIIVISPICLKKNDLRRFKHVFVKVQGKVIIEKTPKNNVYFHFRNGSFFNTDFDSLRLVKLNLFELKSFYNLIEKYPSLPSDLMRFKILFREHEFSSIRWIDIKNHRISFIKIKSDVSDCDYLINHEMPKYKMMIKYFIVHYPFLFAFFSFILSTVITLLIIKPLLISFFPGKF
jgi:hypothetical protein